VGKYYTAGEGTNDNITRPLRFECWMIKAAKIHPEFVTVIAFPLQKW
jgi:hypothetical protein